MAADFAMITVLALAVLAISTSSARGAVLAENQPPARLPGQSGGVAAA
jgi:hypothetical protein